MDIGKKREIPNGFRSIHTNLTANGEFDVIYDNAIDVTPPQRQMTESEYIRELATRENIDIR